MVEKYNFSYHTAQGILITNSEIKTEVRIDSIEKLPQFYFLDLRSLYQFTLKCITKLSGPEDFPTTYFLWWTTIYFINYLLLINLNKIGKRLVSLIPLLFLFDKSLIDIAILSKGLNQESNISRCESLETIVEISKFLPWYQISIWRYCTHIMLFRAVFKTGLNYRWHAKNIDFLILAV